VSTTGKPKAARKTASKEDTEKTTKKRKKARKETFSSYIYKGKSSSIRVCLYFHQLHANMHILLRAVLRQVHPDTGMSNKAMAVLNSFVNDLFERIATESSSALFSAFSFIL